jgi:superfamily II DNA or RNA helicase
MALELVARKRQKTLIIVHRKQLFDQRIERIQTFLKLRKKEI